MRLLHKVPSAPPSDSAKDRRGVLVWFGGATIRDDSSDTSRSLNKLIDICVRNPDRSFKRPNYGRFDRLRNLAAHAINQF
jgi:hypothetical protein